MDSYERFKKRVNEGKINLPFTETELGLELKLIKNNDFFWFLIKYPISISTGIGIIEIKIESRIISPQGKYSYCTYEYTGIQFDLITSDTFLYNFIDINYNECKLRKNDSQYKKRENYLKREKTMGLEKEKQIIIAIENRPDEKETLKTKDRELRKMIKDLLKEIEVRNDSIC